MENNAVVGREGVDIPLVRVEIVFTDVVDGAISTTKWTIRDLPSEGSVWTTPAPPKPSDPASPAKVWRLNARIIETAPVEPQEFRFNNATEHWGLQDFYAFYPNNGDTAVGISVPDRFPQPGGTTTFTAHASNFRGDLSGCALDQQDHSQRDVQVEISLSPGLAFARTPQAPSGTEFDPSTRIWDIGTLATIDAQRRRIILDLPVAVALSNDSLADLPLEKRCLTAEVVSEAPSWRSKRENDTATVCLGEDPKVLLSSGEMVLFDFYPCVGVTNYPCTSADTLELVVEAERTNIALPGLDRVDVFQPGHRGRTWLQPESVYIHVRDPQGRGTKAENVIWSTVATMDLRDSQTKLTSSWEIKESVTVTAPGGGDAPGRWLLTNIYDDPNSNFDLLDAMDSSEVDYEFFSLEEEIGTDPTEYFIDVKIDFWEMGTYKALFGIAGRLSGTTYTDSGTYTFHVGPVSDLEVRDGGASRAVAAGQTAYTVMAVNNGPDAAPSVRVTGLPTGVTESFASEGSYDSASGVWTIGKLDTRPIRQASGLIPFPTLALVAAADAPDITAAIENTQNYSVCINSDGEDVAASDQSVCESTSGNSWHTAAYYDYKDGNNTATIAVESGTGAGAADVPRLLSLQRYGTIAILRWMKVDQVNGFRVTHYHVERDGVIVANDVKEDILGNVYVDLGVDINEPHVSYRVRAVNRLRVPGPWSLPAGGVLAEAPGAPTGLTATASDEVGRIDLSWFAPSAESGLSYRIEHSSDGLSYDVLVQSQSGPTYTHSGLRPATIQYYRVATLKGGVSSRYVYADATTKIEPEAPRGLTATASDVVGRIELGWMAPAGADSSLSYRIEHATNSAGPWQVLDASYVGLTYTDNGRSPATRQYYRVRAVKDLVPSSWAYAEATTKIKPGPPSGLTATASVVVGRINLSWFAPSADSGLGYRIEHSSDGQSWQVLAQSQSGLTYTHNGLSPATRQYYRVATVKDGVNSVWAEAEATTKSDPGTPTGLTATRGYGVGRIDLSWFPPSTGSSPRYRIEHATNSAGPWRVLSSSYSGLTYSHHGLSPGTTHFYRVRAVKDGVTSGWVYAHDTTEAQPVLDERGRTVNVEHRAPLWPENLRFSSVDRTSVTLVWDPPANDGGTPVTGYEYRVYGPCAAGAIDSVCDVVGPTRVSGTSRRITGLNVEGDYEFQVRALNAAGAGDWSLPVQKTVGAATAGGGRVILSPSRLTVPEGGEATYRVKLSSSPTLPLWVIMHWDGDDNQKMEGELPVQQFKALLPSGYDTGPLEGLDCGPYHGEYDWDMAYAWNVGVPITVMAAEDDNSVNGRLTIRHSIYTMPAECLGLSPDPDDPDKNLDPVYDDMFGIALEVMERDND